MRRLRLLLVPILLSLLCSLASAQTNAEVTLTTTTSSLSLGPNATQEVKWTVTNRGPAAGTVSLTLDALPAGWTADLSERSFGLAPNAAKEVTGTVSAAAAAINGTLVLNARIVEDNVAQRSASSPPSTVKLGFIPAPVIVPPPPAKDYTWQIVGAVGSAVFLVGYAAQAKSASIRPYQKNMRINVGTDGWVLIHVRNRSWLPSRVQLRVRGLQGRYVAAFSSPEVRLASRESLQIPLLVKVPVNATPGEHVRFQIQARPNGFSPWMTSREVSFDTLDVKIGGAIPNLPNA